MVRKRLKKARMTAERFGKRKQRPTLLESCVKAIYLGLHGFVLRIETTVLIKEIRLQRTRKVAQVYMVNLADKSSTVNAAIR